MASKSTLIENILWAVKKHGLNTKKSVDFSQSPSVKLPSNTSLSSVTSVDIYIDGNRVDEYTPDGSINRPFKTISSSLSSITKASSLHIAASTYTEDSAVTLPNYPIVSYGNGSTITYTNGLTVQNPNFTRYDLNTIGTTTFSSSSIGRVLINGGSVTGNITVNGLTDIKSCSLLGGTITVNSNGQFLAIVCTITSQITGNGYILIENNNINATKSTPLVTSTTGGKLIIANCIITNLGTGGGVLCNNGATTVPNLITNNAISVASGAPVACGTSVTIYSRNTIGGGINTGTGYMAVTSDLIGTTIMAIGSDATGDIYYRNAAGLLTRLAAGAPGTKLTISAGGLPVWAA